MKHRVTTRILTVVAVAAAVTAGTVGPAVARPVPVSSPAARLAVAPSGYPDWPGYHRSSYRDGYERTVPRVTGRLQKWWDVRLDGAVYGSPIVVNDLTIVATENDTLYAVRGNRVVWQRHVGTPVPRSALACGNIDPLGITGTPVYDPGTRTVFAVAEVPNPTRHVLVGVDPATGALKNSRPADPAGADPSYLQQRGALALARGYVYVPYGGLSGDCGPYRGSVLEYRTDGRPGATRTFTVPTQREGGIWTPPGPVIDASGQMYVTVGNGAAVAPPYDYSDSVLRLDANLRIASYFAPANWAEENRGDLDLGSQGPAIFGGYVFVAGKDGRAYTLRRQNFGGIGGQVQVMDLCRSFGGTAVAEDVVYVPCTDGVRAVRVDAAGRMTVLWHADAAVNGPPVVGGGAVWAMDTANGQLHQIDQATGRTLTRVPTGAVPHFATPALHGTGAAVGTNTGLVLYIAG